MPAPTSTPSVPTSNPDDEVADEVKVFSDEGGEPTDEGPINHSSSSQVDIQEEKLGLTSERGDVRLSTLHHERNKHERLRFQHQAESYRQAAIAQNLFGYHNHPASQYGYHHMPSPFGGFSPVASPMGAMQIPGSRMIPSPMTGSPIASPAFLMGNTTTPPPAHMGGSPGSRAVCSPFPSPHGPHFPHVPMYPGSPDWNAWCNSHAQAPHVMYPPNMNSLDFYKAQYYGLQAAHAAAALRSTSPFIGSPTMVPGSPFNPFSRISSPNSHFLGSGFPQHPFIPPSPDGRYSIHGPEVSSSRVSHSSASSSTSSNKDPSERRFGRQSKKDRMSHVKKPLNAFMLFMKENRSEVQAECTLKESAAINQILGKKWHALDRAEQAKYYDMAKRERENHAKNNPGWTAKDNYAQCGKKKRRKKEKSDEPKKCRAIFGIDRQGEWCKPCRRKKKCVRFQQNGAFMANGGDYREPKSSSESISCVSSSMQALSPSADSAASSTSPSSAAASTG